MLTYQEIMSTLQDVDLTPEQIDEIYEQFNVLGIDVTPDKVDIENLENDENENCRILLVLMIIMKMNI